MKDELAEELLSRIMDWNPPAVATLMPRIQALASLKYDEYEGFRPGIKFLESLSSWLVQFEPADRASAIAFLLERLVFVSRAELDHLIAIAYPDRIRRHLITRAAADLGVAPHLLGRIVGSNEFRGLHRRTLLLGLSDGARLDRLRRSSPLSHEQFYLVPELRRDRASSMVSKLRDALEQMAVEQEPTFRQIVLVDDFYGSGLSLLRRENGGWAGKLWRAAEQRDELASLGVLSSDVEVLVILYIATDQAANHLVQTLPEAGLDSWVVRPVLQLNGSVPLSPPADQAMLDLSLKYYDPSMVDQHKAIGGETVAHGFNDCRLPLVLSHNTPNNSLAVLWADTTESKSGSHRRALFARYERHHEDRP